MQRWLLALVLALPCGPAAAQEVGSVLRPVELLEFRGTEARSLDDLLGRAVLIEFFAHWCEPCGAQVAHLNELQEGHGERGLSVLGVTGSGEDRGKTDAWIRARGVTYAVARDPGGALAGWLGVRSIPHAVLIDPHGRIVWRGHPASLPGEALEKALAGALAKPLWGWPQVWEPLSKGRWPLALAAAEQLGPDVPLAELLRERVARKLALVVGAREAGDYLRAQELAEKAAAELAGLPAAVTAAEILTALVQDGAVQRVISGQLRLRDLAARVETVTSQAAAQELLTALEELRAAYPGSIVERDAERSIEALRRRMG